MKIRIELEETLEEAEVIIRCKSIDEKILHLQKLLKNETKTETIQANREGKECFLELKEILFFETSDGMVHAHTKKAAYDVKYRLYELEELLPGYFMRISKSTVVNTSLIFSITKNLSSSSEIEFSNTHKKVYVSRHYKIALNEKMMEERLR